MNREVTAPNSLDTIQNPFGVGSYCKCFGSYGGHDCSARVFEFVRVNFLMEVIGVRVCVMLILIVAFCCFAVGFPGGLQSEFPGWAYLANIGYGVGRV